MSFFTGGGGNNSLLSGSPHADVLTASIPEDSNARHTFLQELLRRAKGAVQSNNYYPDAIALYEKSLEIEDTTDSAIVHANLSLCYGKIHNWDRALQHAQTATEIDPAYTKAWYRLAQAYAAQSGSNDSLAKAIDAIQTALQLEPQNKTLQQELQKLLQQQQQQSATANTNTPTTTKMTSNPSKTKSSKSSVIKVDNNNDDDDDEINPNDVTFKPSEPVRGYKIVNGKKTSYFHTELSEETKQLIGDIAPKKLDITTTTGSTTTSSSSLSAWNQAQTWEEKDCTEWAKRTFIETFQKNPQDKHQEWSIQSVQVEPTSHASIVTSRGKKRYLYEFTNVQITWKYHPPNDDDAAVVVGTLIIPEIDGSTDMDDLDITNVTITEWNNNMDTEEDETKQRRHVLDQCRIHLGKQYIPQTIQTWVQLFHDTY
jgi:hypothetical protein